MSLLLPVSGWSRTTLVAVCCWSRPQWPQERRANQINVAYPYRCRSPDAVSTGMAFLLWCCRPSMHTAYNTTACTVAPAAMSWENSACDAAPPPPSHLLIPCGRSVAWSLLSFRGKDKFAESKLILLQVLAACQLAIGLLAQVALSSHVRWYCRQFALFPCVRAGASLRTTSLSWLLQTRPTQPGISVCRASCVHCPLSACFMRLSHHMFCLLVKQIALICAVRAAPAM